MLSERLIITSTKDKQLEIKFYDRNHEDQNYVGVRWWVSMHSFKFGMSADSPTFSLDNKKKCI